MCTWFTVEGFAFGVFVDSRRRLTGDSTGEPCGGEGKGGGLVPDPGDRSLLLSSQPSRSPEGGALAGPCVKGCGRPGRGTVWSPQLPLPDSRSLCGGAFPRSDAFQVEVPRRVQKCLFNL